ncbi:two-component system, sensor histidine kinase YcbA [Hathewaya proteolytica DSM 3090]|uniref:histidine kinase n=1 Tax=Hathewaya proteolytica DSM 3090 TaxID=1121331 RepID=A0A1M6QKY7_9CLOT|nr:sensor histidine kinase [Hathewaya proteolytica]SHK20713.1 two-component system, sensor histidine kinase YcbA [Hathewaya proteolytica DSM 3090]
MMEIDKFRKGGVTISFKLKVTEWKKSSWFIAINIALLSQVYLQTNMFNLRISMGIVMLPVYYYMMSHINFIYTGLLSSLCVYSMRIMTYTSFNGFNMKNLYNGVYTFFPEIFFYVVYFCAFGFLTAKLNHRRKKNVLLYLCLICDFTANLSEMLIRSFINNSSINLQGILGIAVFALLRSLLIWAIINIMDRYSLLISRREHEVRYKKLLDTTSRLKTELYWMEKSMADIEQVMGNAYDLYNNISDDDVIKGEVLSIAKDIHEIKKQNMLVLRGLEETLEDRQEENGMSMEDIFDILNSSMKKYMTNTEKNVNLKFRTTVNFNTKRHYYIMSILRNLIMNAMDASREQGYIYICEEQEGSCCKLTIKDNGDGISTENMKYIFSPGFSTKINYDTGSVNRGLGLSIVKEIVENKLGGHMKVESRINEFTIFTIYIPLSNLTE